MPNHKEHAGGIPEIGTDYSGHDRSYRVVGRGRGADDQRAHGDPVIVEHFNFDDLDSLQDQLREAAQRGDSSKIERMIGRAETERATEAICRLLAILTQAKKPAMLAQQILWALGRTDADGLGLKDLAKRYRVSKQAFQQGAESLFAALELDIRPGRRCLGTAVNGRNMRNAGKNTFSISSWSLRALRWLTARQSAQPINDWPPTQRRAIKQALKPIVDFYEKM